MTSRQHEMPTSGANSAQRKILRRAHGRIRIFLEPLVGSYHRRSHFFLSTFLAIVGIMIYNGLGHHVDYADSYKLISFPIACVMLAASLIFFATLWLRRKFSGN